MSISTCIIFCISIRISAVGNLPLEYLNLSRSSTLCNPASTASGGCLSPGLAISAILNAQARPKTTISSKEFAPSHNNNVEM